MSEKQKTIFRMFQVWTIRADHECGFWLCDQGGYIVPLELWEEMKEAIDSLYENTTPEERQEYNDERDRHRGAPTETRRPSPRTGKVYLLQGKGTRWFKIGVTTSISSRIKQIGVNSPFPLVMIAHYDVEDAAMNEREWHDRFSDKRTHGEWFELDDGDVLEFVARSQQCLTS